MWSGRVIWRVLVTLAVTVLAAVFACSSGQGVYVEIHSPVDLAAVELFIGDTTETDFNDCTINGCTIAPPRGSGSAIVRYVGDGFTSSSPISARATMTGKTITFHVMPGVSEATIPALLVVGYDGQGQPAAAFVVHDVPLKDKNFDIRVDLDMLSPFSGGSGERATVWRRPGDGSGSQSACALVLHADPARHDEWFGPFDDADCDGAQPRPATPSECNPASPWLWCDSNPLGLSEANCVASAESGACRLAGPPCVDNPAACPQMDDCVPSSVVGCLPTPMCSVADAVGCESLDAQCLARIFSMSAVPHIGCPSLATAGTTCVTQLDAALASTILAGKTCMQIQLADPTATQPFKVGPTVTMGSITYTVTPVSGPCVVNLTVTPISAPPPVPVLVDFQTTNGEHHFAPLELGSGSCAGTIAACSEDVGPAAAYVCP